MDLICVRNTQMKTEAVGEGILLFTATRLRLIYFFSELLIFTFDNCLPRAHKLQCALQLSCSINIKHYV